MRVLRARLYERELAEQQAKIASERKAQVGSGERSEKIRTYNFPQGRVTDHRIKLTSHNLDGVLGGDLAEFTERSLPRRSGSGCRGCRRRLSLAVPRWHRYARRWRPRSTPWRLPAWTSRGSTPRCCWVRRWGAGGRLWSRIRRRRCRPAAARAFGEMVRRRLRREPVAYILGRKGFREIELAVDRRVLIPRPETELLVEVALERRPGRGAGRRHRLGRDRAGGGRRAAGVRGRRDRHLARGAGNGARERRAPRPRRPRALRRRHRPRERGASTSSSPTSPTSPSRDWAAPRSPRSPSGSPTRRCSPGPTASTPTAPSSLPAWSSFGADRTPKLDHARCDRARGGGGAGVGGGGARSGGRVRRGRDAQGLGGDRAGSGGGAMSTRGRSRDRQLDAGGEAAAALERCIEAGGVASSPPTGSTGSPATRSTRRR